MPTEILQKSGTPVVWADTTDYVDNDGLGARTHQLDLTSIASLAARQGAKADLGAVRAAAYAVTMRVEFDVAPDSGKVVSLWWAPSPSATAAVGNPGGTSGADEAYTGTTGDSLPDSILQCKLIGNLVCTSDVAPVPQSQTFIYSPEHRYGFPVVYNEANQAFEGDAIEMAVSFTPIIDEAQ
jgi:hypothetical protein